MSSFIRSTHATKRSRSRGQLGSRHAVHAHAAELARAPAVGVCDAPPTPRVSTSTATPGGRAPRRACARAAPARPRSPAGTPRRGSARDCSSPGPYIPRDDRRRRPSRRPPGGATAQAVAPREAVSGRSVRSNRFECDGRRPRRPREPAPPSGGQSADRRAERCSVRASRVAHGRAPRSSAAFAAGRPIAVTAAPICNRSESTHGLEPLAAATARPSGRHAAVALRRMAAVRPARGARRWAAGSAKTMGWRRCDGSLTG